MDITLAKALTPQLRKLDNYLGTTSSLVRQGALKDPVFGGAGDHASIARELAAKLPDHRHMSRVQGALREAEQHVQRGNSAGLANAIRDARNNMDLAMRDISVKPHLARSQVADGAASISPSHAFGDEHLLDSLGSVARGRAPHTINGPDGAIDPDGHSLAGGSFDVPDIFLG